MIHRILDGTVPRLSEAEFSFDLDADGTAEDILMLEQAVGFYAWTKIKDAGIGAIYLANSNTPIEVLDDDGDVQARIKRSGVALGVKIRRAFYQIPFLYWALVVG